MGSPIYGRIVWLRADRIEKDSPRRRTGAGHDPCQQSDCCGPSLAMNDGVMPGDQTGISEPGSSIPWSPGLGSGADKSNRAGVTGSALVCRIRFTTIIPTCSNAVRAGHLPADVPTPGSISA